MSIQEELHNIRNQKTLNDYNQLFHKLNDMVKEELGTDIFTFIKDRERLSNTVHHRTITEWSYREDSISKKIKELQIEEMYNDLSGMEGL